MGAPGWGWPRGPICPVGAPGPGEVVIWNAAPAPPAHRLEGAALPQPRGSPLGGNWRQRGKSLEPEAGQRRLRRGSGGCGGAAAALGGVRLAEKSGRAAAAVCAKFWVARKDAGEGRRAEPRKLWPEPEGDPRRPPRQLADIGASGFCSPLASLGWVDAQPLNPSQPRGNNFILSEAAGLRLAGQRRGSRLCPFVVLRISPLILGFL